LVASQKEEDRNHWSTQQLLSWTSEYPKGYTDLKKGGYERKEWSIRHHLCSFEF